MNFIFFKYLFYNTLPNIMQSNREDIQELLKGAYNIRHFFGHTRCEERFKMRKFIKKTVLKKNQDFKENREKDIADFKAFSASLEMPPMRK